MIKDLVSIIIPCYNHEKYIIGCLESILEEDYSNKEIIILDDGSKDKSVDLITEFITKNQNENIKLYTQENCGVVKTLNKLIDIANGEFIAIIASDDKLFNNGISKRVQYLKNNSEKLAVIGNANVIDLNNEIMFDCAATKLYRASKKLLNNPKTFYKELIYQWCVVGPCLLLKKETYEIVGKYDEQYSIEDRDFYLRLINQNLLGYIDDTVASYRVHNLNMSIHSGNNKVRIECAKINYNNSKRFVNFFEKLFLKSFYIDVHLMEKNLISLYWIFKLIRFSFIKFYRILLAL